MRWAAVSTLQNVAPCCSDSSGRVEDQDRQLGTHRLDVRPSVPLRVEIPVFGQAHFIQVVGHRIGELHLQLLKRRFVIALRVTDDSGAGAACVYHTATVIR